jgi:hypothetical protein
MADSQGKRAVSACDCNEASPRSNHNEYRPTEVHRQTEVDAPIGKVWLARMCICSRDLVESVVASPIISKTVSRSSLWMLASSASAEEAADAESTR